MTNAPAFQHYPGDFLSDPNVGLMSYEEIGIYWLLVNWCWKLGELPDDLDELTAYARASKDAFERMWTTRISKSFVKKDGKWIHPHLEAERRKHKQRKKQTSEAASARWGKQRTSVDANAMQTQCERITSEQTPALQTQCPSSSSSSSSSTSVKEALLPIGNNGAEAPDSEVDGDAFLEDKIWKDGLRLLLAKGGKSEKVERGFLGKLVKDHGRSRLAEAIARAYAMNVPEPKAYIIACLQERQENKKTTLEDHYDYWERREKEADDGGHTDQAPTDKWLGDGQA